MGRLRPGKRSHEAKATSGMRTRPAKSLIGPIGAGHDPQLARSHEDVQRRQDEAGDIGLLITHRLLHQSPFDQLAQPVLPVEDLDHILLGRGAGGRMQAHPPGRDISQPLQEVADRGRGLARRGGRVGNRLRPGSASRFRGRGRGHRGSISGFEDRAGPGIEAASRLYAAIAFASWCRPFSRLRSRRRRRPGRGRRRGVRRRRGRRGGRWRGRGRRSRPRSRRSSAGQRRGPGASPGAAPRRPTPAGWARGVRPSRTPNCSATERAI